MPCFRLAVFISINNCQYKIISSTFLYKLNLYYSGNDEEFNFDTKVAASGRFWVTTY